MRTLQDSCGDHGLRRVVFLSTLALALVASLTVTHILYAPALRRLEAGPGFFPPDQFALLVHTIWLLSGFTVVGAISLVALLSGSTGESTGQPPLSRGVAFSINAVIVLWGCRDVLMTLIAARGIAAYGGGRALYAVQHLSAYYELVGLAGCGLAVFGGIRMGGRTLDVHNTPLLVFLTALAGLLSCFLTNHALSFFLPCFFLALGCVLAMRGVSASQNDPMAEEGGRLN